MLNVVFICSLELQQDPASSPFSHTVYLPVMIMNYFYLERTLTMFSVIYKTLARFLILFVKMYKC